MRILAVTRHGCREEVTLRVVSPGSALMGTQTDLIVIDPEILHSPSEHEREMILDWIDLIRCRLVPGNPPQVIGGESYARIPEIDAAPAH